MADLENTEKDEKDAKDEKDEKDEKVASEETEETEEEDGETEEDLEDAKRLYRALKNPQTSERTIRLLAADLGLDFDTKGEKKDAKDAILDALETELGQYKFLAPQLKKAFDKILGEHTKSIDQKFDNLQREKIITDANTATQEMLRDAEFANLYPRIMKLMDEVHPAKNVPPKTHLKRLFALAKDEVAEKAKTSSKSDKLKKSIRDVSGKIKDASVGGEDKQFKKDRPLTRREAIKETLEELEAGD